MGTVLGYIIALVVVGGLLFLAASFAFGRGEEMAPALPEGTPVELPDDRLAGGDDLRALRLSVAVRGYRMDEVDWLLDRLSDQVDTRDREIARLRSVLHVERVPDPDEPELLTHPHPAVRDLPLDWTRRTADPDPADPDPADHDLPTDRTRRTADPDSADWDLRTDRTRRTADPDSADPGPADPAVEPAAAGSGATRSGGQGAAGEPDPARGAGPDVTAEGE